MKNDDRACRCELVGLDVADILERKEGLLVTIRRSKTDQKGPASRSRCSEARSPALRRRCAQPITGRLDRITNAQKPEETAPGERAMKRLMIDLVQLSCMFAIVMGIVVVAASLLI